MHQLIIKMDIPTQAARFLLQKVADLSDALGQRARNIVGQRDAHRDAATEGVKQDGIDIFRGGEDKAQRRRMARTVIAKTVEIPFIHKQKQLFLVLCRETMHFIEKQKSAIGIIKGAAFLAVSAGESAAGIAEKGCRKQLRIVGVIGAVKLNEGFVRCDNPALESVLINQHRQMAFADAALPGEQDRQTVIGIVHRRAAQRDGVGQAPVRANQRLEGVVLFRHYARWLSLIPAVLLHIEAHRTGVFFTQITVIA